MDEISAIACCLCNFTSHQSAELEAHIWNSHPQIFKTTEEPLPASVADDQVSNKLDVPIKTELEESGSHEEDEEIHNTLAHLKVEIPDDVKFGFEHVCEITKKTVRKRIKLHMKKYHMGIPRVRVLKKPPGVYPCKTCGVVLPSRSLARHLKEVHDCYEQTPRKVRKCTVCGLNFRNFYKLQDHRWKEHKIGSTWKCEICCKIFHRHDTFQAHTKTAHKKNLKLTTPCYRCETMFPGKEALQCHLKDEHYEHWPEDLFCEICEDVFIGRAALKVHQLEKHELNQTKAAPPTKITCNRCQKTLGDLAGFFLHYREEHSTTEAKATAECSTCDESFADHETLKSHNRDFHADRHCGICDKTFNRKDNFEKHQSTGRGLCGQAEIYPCKNCEEVFSSKDQLKIHLLEIHDNQWPMELQCQTCQDVYYNEANLVKHVKYVHKLRKYEAPYECSTCKEVFWTKVSLQHHQKRAHHKSGKLDCQDCGKAYADKSVLSTHRKLFHLEKADGKSYSCCSQTFKSYAKLKAHRRENRCLRCRICGKGFFLPSALERHQLEVHVVKPEPAVSEICHFCDDSFDTQEALYSHQQEHHKSEVDKGHGLASYECKVCFVSCQDPDALEVHQNVNHPHLKCQVCKTFCENELALTRHVRRTHKLPQQKPFSCKFCKSRIVGIDSFKDHLKKAHKGHWFEDLQCTGCSKIFYSKEQLRRHQHSECQSKPSRYLSCQLCGLLFKTKMSLETHLVAAHGKKNPSCTLCGKQYRRPGDLKRHFAKCVGEAES